MMLPEKKKNKSNVYKCKMRASLLVVLFKCNDRLTLQVKINVFVSLTFTRLSVSDIKWDYVCVWECVRVCESERG